MGGLSGVTDWVGDTIGGAFEAVGDAVSWVGDKVKETWDSKLGRIAIIVAASYFAFVVLPEMMAASAVETAAVAEGTGVVAAGSAEMTAASAGAQLGAETAVAAEVGAGGAGALEAAEGVAAMESVAGTAGAVDLTLAGAAPELVAAPAAEVGVLDAVGGWAAENPMMAYGGMMVGGQAVSGYMQGEQMKEMEEQRLKEEQDERNRQNIWGVNYAEGGEAISAGDRLKDLNRTYFDSAAPINPAVQTYETQGVRQKQGVLDQVTGTANPDKFSHRA